MKFAAEMKAIFLSCSLPSSWDTFHTTITNSTLGGVLKFDDVVGSLLAKEIKKKTMDMASRMQLLMWIELESSSRRIPKKAHVANHIDART